MLVTDPDHGENHFQTPASLAGSYGNFTFDATTGVWSYALDHDLADGLADGQVVHDMLTVTSARWHRVGYDRRHRYRHREATNHPPTDIDLSNSSVAENSANGTVVGSLSAIDPDAGDSFTFSLLNNAEGRFAINGVNLVVAGPLDYETATSQQVTVRVTYSSRCVL